MSNVKKIVEIEYLRALAIGFTLIHHTVSYLYPDPYKSEFIVKLYSSFTFFGGVDLFFCISGFVIFKSFFNIVNSRANNLTTFMKLSLIFWVKRFLRLMPAAWLWIGIYLICSYYANSWGAFGVFEQNLNDMKAAALQYANIYGLECWGPGKMMNCGPNGIYWSLSLEEQFYFILPVFFFFTRRFFALSIFTVFLLQFFLERPVWSLGWALRTDAIALGILLAVITFKPKWTKLEPKWLNQSIFLKSALVWFLIFLLAYVPAQNHIPFTIGWLALTSGFLVWLASYDKGYLLRHSNFLHPILSWAGSRSYAIYLTHIIAFKLSFEILVLVFPANYNVSNESFIILLPLGMMLTLIFSEFTYRFIEKPIRTFANQRFSAN